MKISLRNIPNKGRNKEIFLFLKIVEAKIPIAKIGVKLEIWGINLVKSISPKANAIKIY
jgi:hypothetical protein